MRIAPFLWLSLGGCPSSESKSAPESSETSSDPCLTAEGFEDCFTDAWCEAWTACGFTEPCEQTRPWTTHYENGEGFTEIDCEDISDPQRAECLDLVPSSSCDELYDAAQLDDSNGPWIDVCITRSCV
jgi:hypothetical protein